MAITIHSILYTAALGLARSDLKRTNYKIAAKININSPTAKKGSGTVYKCFRVSFIVRRNSFQVWTLAGEIDCAEFLGKTLYSHSASLHPGV